jgi:3-isopropylmalate/(R)-2-methylmalate dehydratase small subunit
MRRLPSKHPVYPVGLQKNFARIFYRNSINIGLPILECEEAADCIRQGDEITVDYETGLIKNLTRNETYHAEPISSFYPDILQKMA